MVKLLVTGADGQVGWEISRQARKAGFEPVMMGRPQLDITDPMAVRDVFESQKPGLLINAAAYTKVDQAESQPEAAYAINRDAPGMLAKQCDLAGIPMIHFSTDYVFDGTHTAPYAESVPISPVGVYARSKAAGEARVREALKRHMILRTSWVYGVHGKNFVKTMLRIGKEKSRIGVVNDQYGCPTAAADLAATALAIAGRMAQAMPIEWGTYHYCGQGVTTWHAFAETVFRFARTLGYPHRPGVFPITTAEYPTPARRPAYSALDCTKIFRNLGISPIAWQERLSSVLTELLDRP